MSANTTNRGTLADFLGELEPGYLRLYLSSLWGETQYWATLLEDLESRTSPRRWTNTTVKRWLPFWRRLLPSSVGVRLLSAEMHRREGRWAAAQGEIRAVFKLKPGLPAAHALRAKVTMTRAARAGRASFAAHARMALDDCHRGIVDPLCAWAYGLLGFAHSGLGSRQVMYRLLIRAVQRHPKRPELLICLAMHEFSADTSECALHLETALRLRPDDLVLRAFRGELHRRNGRLTAALGDLDAAVRGLPRYDRPYLWRSKIHRALGNRLQAERDIERAIHLEPLNGRAHFERYVLHLEGNDLSGALGELKRAIILEGQCPWDVQCDEALIAWTHLKFKLLCRMKNYPRALTVLQEAHERDPKYIWSQPGKESPAECLSQIDEALRAYPKEPWFHAWRGRTWASLGDHARAESDLNRAIELDRSQGRCYLWRAQARLRGGAIAGCLSDLELARQRGACASLLEATWAEADLQRKAWRSALAHARHAARIDPTAVRALIAWTQALLGLGCHRKAQAVLQRAHELAPGVREVIVLLAQFDGPERLFPFDIYTLKSANAVGLRRGWARRRLQDLLGPLRRRLRHDLRRASKVSLAKIHAMRGWASFQTRRRQQALDDLGQALQLDPSNAVYHVWRAEVFRDEEDWNGAEHDLSAAIDLEPGAAAAYRNRADVYMKLGNVDAAISDALRLIELYPRGERARRLLATYQRCPSAQHAQAAV